MEARLIRAALIVAAALSLGASYRTQNFVVTAETPELAQEIAQAAETYRRDLATEWLGHELQPWSDICPIRAEVSPQLGAGGVTSFSFDYTSGRGRPTAWTMALQGSRERVLDSVLPHEITHTIFATHFGCPLPRWADEGACTTVEHASERHKQQKMLIQFLTTDRGIAFNRMFAMREYPRDILPLYSQGYSLARFLIANGGKQKFVQYVGDGMRDNDWPAATQQHYGYKDLSELQVTWLDWVRRGSPEMPEMPKGREQTELAAAAPAASQPSPIQPAAAELASAQPATAQLAVAQQPAAKTPAPAALASSAAAERAGGSWYARRRDEARGQQAAGSSGAAAAQVATAQQPRPAQPQSGVQQAVTRPQGMVQPQQAILEWNRDAQAYAPGSIRR